MPVCLRSTKPKTGNQPAITKLDLVKGCFDLWVDSIHKCWVYTQERLGGRTGQHWSRLSLSQHFFDAGEVGIGQHPLAALVEIRAMGLVWNDNKTRLAQDGLGLFA